MSAESTKNLISSNIFDKNYYPPAPCLPLRNPNRQIEFIHLFPRSNMKYILSLISLRDITSKNKNIPRAEGSIGQSN